jgi:hypothetical protein
VQENDVAWPYRGRKLRRVLLEHGSVMAMLFLAQRATVPFHAVEMVVEPLRDREELLVAFDDQPARVDARAPDVGQEHLEHFGYAATDGGRVDTHDCTPEGLTQTFGPFEQRLDFPGLDHLAEDPGINDRERHLLHERPPSRDTAEPMEFGHGLRSMSIGTTSSGGSLRSTAATVLQTSMSLATVAATAARAPAVGHRVLLRAAQPVAAAEQREHQRLLREYFPNGADLSILTRDAIDSVADEINRRPRRRHSYLTPSEVHNQLVASTA